METSDRPDRRGGRGAATASFAPQLSIVIPTHDRREDLAVLLAALAAVDAPALPCVEVVVVASCCSDGTRALVDAIASRFPFPLRCVAEARLGVSIARNRGLREAQAEWVAFLDDDVCVAPGWLRSALRAIQVPGIDLLSGRVILRWEARRPAWWSAEFDPLLSIYDPGERSADGSQNLANGGNFAARRAVVDRVGGFHEALGRRGRQLLSGEETEFLKRALASGFRMLHVPEMLVEHRVRAERATVGYLARVVHGTARSRLRWRHRLGSRRILKALGSRPLRLPVLVVAGAYHRLRGRHTRSVELRLRRAAIRGRFRGTLERIASLSRGVQFPE
jgi:GT2 family glycosyltransferase